VYCRVSRLDQNPQLQEHEAKELVGRRGWDLTEVYLDHGVSGSREKRPELDRLLADAKKRKFDILVVWRSDRFFRSLRHMVNTLADLDAIGVRFVSVTEPFDGTTPQGQLLIHLVSAFSEFERQILIERTKAGLAAAKRRGARLGRPRVVVDRDRAKKLQGEGWSIRKIALNMKVGIGTVQRALAG
jgi:DNA invertase Pin-like site-specific DNA recombinase